MTNTTTFALFVFLSYFLLLHIIICCCNDPLSQFKLSHLMCLLCFSSLFLRQHLRQLPRFTSKLPPTHRLVSGLSSVSPGDSTPASSPSPGPTRAKQPISITCQSPIAPFLCLTPMVTCLNPRLKEPCCPQIGCWTSCRRVTQSVSR